MDRCIDVAVKIFKVSATENCTSIKYYVAFVHVAELVKKRKCKFMNSLVACRFDFEVLQLAFTELFAFCVFISMFVLYYLSICPSVVFLTECRIKI